jgi:hypothetical protein
MHLITHIFNEEFLLPYWLKHHVPLVDHGIVIDYASTDNSLDIVRELAPDWEIIQSCNKWFIEPDIGEEVMRVERGIGGWKMTLNITEFLLHPDIKGYCHSLDDRNKKAMCTTGVIMVDRPSERSEITDDLLVLQKTFGYFEEDVRTNLSTTMIDKPSRSRLIHCHPDGRYDKGRHVNDHTSEQDSELFLCWFGWTPFDYVKERKQQIQHRVPTSQKSLPDWYKIYCVNDDDLENMYTKEHSRSYDLLDNEKYKRAYENFQTAYSS